jgi:putative PIN family toxin of toxin-antitoxin system
MLKPIVVFDTNVFISGLIAKHGPPARALDLWRNRKIRLVVSTRIVEEILDVLRRPALVQSQNISSANVARLERLLQRKRVTAHVTPRVHFAICRDPEDNKFLDSAVAAKADYLVTFDADLLSIGEFHGVKIVRVQAFLDLVDR